MAKKGVKLPAKKINEMWKMFQGGYSAPAIARACKVSQGVVLKYRRTEGWAGRLAAISKKAIEKADVNAADLLAENMKIVRYAKSRLLEQMKDIAKGEKISQMPVTDLDKLIRLEAFLGGGVDSRPDVPQPKEELAKLSVEQLIVIHNTLIAGNGHRRKPITAVVKKSGGNGDGDN